MYTKNIQPKNSKGMLKHFKLRLLSSYRIWLNNLFVLLNLYLYMYILTNNNSIILYDNPIGT